MKKTFASVMAMLLAFLMVFTSFAEEAATAVEAPEYDELTVASTTMMTGSFFTDLWGNSTSDADVRKLLHGLNLIKWDSASGTYGINDAVVTGFIAMADKEGNRTYTFALREDLCYSDGSAISAWDYAFSFLLLSAPEMAQLGAAIHESDYIFGMPEYISGEREVISGIHVPSDYMLTITIEAEYLPYFYEMAMMTANPYPISVIAPGCKVYDEGLGVYIASEEEDDADVFTAELLKETLFNAESGYATYPKVVSGPYTLVSYNAETHTAEFEVNENYCGNVDGSIPEIEKLVFTHVANDEMVEKLASGEIDLVNKAMNADAVEEAMKLVAEGNFTAANYARSGFAFVNFSCERPAMQSEAVRKAIAHCMDKEQLIAEHVRNFGLSVGGYYGIGQWMYQQAQGLAGEGSLEDMAEYAYDLDAAAKLLEEDGWKQEGDVRVKTIGEEPVALKLKYVYAEGNATAEYVGEALKEELQKVGIVLDVECLPYSEVLKLYYRQTERDCDMIYMATNFGEVYDPANAFSVEDANVGNYNRSGIADEALSALASDISKTESEDVEGYVQKWVNFQIRYSEVLPALPLFSNVYFDFHIEALEDYYISSYMSWADAIVEAYIETEAEEEAPEATESEAEFID